MTPDGSVRDREIVNARVIVTCPGRNFVTPSPTAATTPAVS